jgi:hypothetical protein
MRTRNLTNKQALAQPTQKKKGEQMKKIEMFIVAAVLAVSAIAFAEDKAGTAPTPGANTTPQQTADKIARQTSDTILYRAAMIGADCAVDETIKTILAGDDQQDKKDANASMARIEKQIDENVASINKCIEDGIARMKEQMLAEKLAPR